MAADRDEPQAQPKSAPRYRRRFRTTFWLCVWLFVTLFIAKASHSGNPSRGPISRSEWLHDLVLYVNQDLLYVLLVGAVGQILLWSTSKHPRLQRAAWIAVAAWCVVSVIYAVVS